MSNAPELKYTDRDVRDDPELMPLAIAYVLNYTGEFDPLVEAKEYLDEEGELTTALARKVLNCMRHDANVLSKLPRPQRRTDNVVAFARSPRKKREDKSYDHCGDQASHEYHWDSDKRMSCPGTPFAINREGVRLKVTVKAPFGVARQGRVIHSMQGYGYCDYTPPRHRWGLPDHWYMDRQLGRFHAKTVCKNPSWLIDPILLEEDQLPKYLGVTVFDFEIRMCPRCTPGS